MSYTNVDLVRQYLATSFPTRDRYCDQVFVFTADDYLSFFNGAIEASSLRVKSVHGHRLVQQSVTLAESGNLLANSPLVRGSVEVASDSSLGTVYEENVDHVVDYENGKLAIKSGGDLSPGQTVSVWHQAFHIYDGAEDYQVDAERGRLRRRSGGNIAPGETVYLDFTPVNNSFNDDVLSRAVVEANGLLEAEVDPARQFGADAVLQVAATYRALEIVCHVAAARELSAMSGNDRTALAWVTLGEKFAERAATLLRTFHPPVDGPASPAHG